MSHSIKYFDNGGKNMSLMIKDENVLVKYSDVLNKMKEKLKAESFKVIIFMMKYT